MKQEQLKMLVAVVETGSFRKAAERVYKSQAAVSKAIKGLEDELALPLFSRDSYRPQLTREGKAFYQKAQEVIVQFDRLQAFGKELSLGAEPEISVAINAICPLPTLLALIKQLTNKYPKTQINLSIETLGGPLDRLNQGEADLTITTLIKQDPTLESTYLYDVRMLMVAAHDFEPVRFKQRSQDQMKNYSQIIVRDDSRHSQRRSVNVLQGGRCWKVNNLFSKKDIILAGLGWGQLPEHMICDELQNGSLVPLSIEDFALQNNPRICLVRKRLVQPGPVARELWETIRHNLSKNKD